MQRILEDIEDRGLVVNPLALLGSWVKSGGGGDPALRQTGAGIYIRRDARNEVMYEKHNLFQSTVDRNDRIDGKVQKQAYEGVGGE